MLTLQTSERRVQLALALLLVIPLAFAFAGSGGFADAYSSGDDPAALAARRAAVFWAALRSLGIGTLATAVALLLGIPAGWALAQSRRPIALLGLCALPLVLPASVAISGWVELLAPAGAASRFKVPIPGFAPESRGILFSLWGTGVVLGLNLWPVVAYESWPAFRRARNESYDAALLGGSRWQAFSRVILPQTRNELAAAGLLVFLIASSDFSVSSLLLVRTLPVEIHDALMLGKNATAAWAALPLLPVAILLTVLLGRLSGRRMTASVAANASSGRAPAALACLALAVCVSFGVPMLACLYGAIAGGQPMSSVFSAGVDALGVSVRLAGAAAVLALLVGVVRVIVWPQQRAPALLWAGLILLALPGSFVAAALLTAQLKVEPLVGAGVLPALILGGGYLLRFIYIPLRLLEEGLAAIDPHLMEAAASAGQGRFARGASIALPLVGAHLVAAAALVFVFVLGEVPMAHKLAPPGVVPATVWLFQQQHMGYDEAVFGLSLLLGCVTAVILCISVVTVKVLTGSQKGPA